MRITEAREICPAASACGVFGESNLEKKFYSAKLREAEIEAYGDDGVFSKEEIDSEISRVFARWGLGSHTVHLHA